MFLRLTVGGLCLAAAIAGSAGGASEAGTIPGQYIVVLKDGVDPSVAVESHKSKYGAEVNRVYRHALKGYAAKLSPAAVSALAHDRSVAFVADDGEVTASTICSPTVTQCLPLGLDRIDVEQSSALGPGPGPQGAINVAVLDTGIDLTHPDLNVAGGVDCVNKNGNGQTRTAMAHTSRGPSAQWITRLVSLERCPARACGQFAFSTRRVLGR